MRFVVLVSVLLAVIAAVSCVPAKAKTDCPKVCPFLYEPVCAKAEAGKERTLSFGNKCVLDTYNCEHPTEQFKEMSKGECPGSTGVRLQ